MADSTLAALGAHATVVDADSSYIENAGVAKKVAASVLKTYVSDTPTLVTPVLGTPSAGDISACTSTDMVLTTPDLGVPSAITLTNADGTVTNLTLVTPALGTVASGDISACTSTDMALTTPDLGVPSAIDITAATGTVTDLALVAPVITGLTTGSITAGITANAGGGGVGSAVALTTDINEISTCATGGDSVSLPTAVPGQVVRIINNGAAACDVYPFTSDNCGGGVDTAVSLGIGANITYICYTTALWVAAS